MLTTVLFVRPRRIFLLVFYDKHVYVLYTGQLSLLPSVGREMSTGQSAVMLWGWE